MASLAKITIVLLLLTFFLGQLVKINLFGMLIPPIDIFIGILAIINILHFRKIKNTPLLLFLVFTWISYLINLLYYPFSLKAIFYLLRLNFLLSFFIFPLDQKILSPRLNRLLSLVLLSTVIFGLIQYLVWPDLTTLSAFNWDPHLYRLVSTFLDPTFTGLIFLLFLIYIFLTSKNYYLMPITYLGLALTYSRSSLLSFLIAFSFLAFKLKKSKIFFYSLTIFIATILILPRLPGEGTKLERTSSIKAKIENYTEGFKLFLKSPVIGHGYNNLFFARTIKKPSSHANSGFDGSLMTILTTTGIIGLTFFTLGLANYYSSADLLHRTLLLTILFHSLFANSLLYPWVLILLFLTRYRT